MKTPPPPSRTPRLVALLTSSIVGLIVGVLAASAADAPSVDDLSTHELIDTTLGSRTIRLLGWNTESITIIDESGIRRDEPVADVLAVLRTEPTEPRWRRPSPDDLAGGTAVVVELTDGQRFIGSLGPWDSEEIADRARDAVSYAGVADAIAVLSPLQFTNDATDPTPRGTRLDAVPLESIGRVLFDPWATGHIAQQSVDSRDEPSAEATIDDELVFVNGDRLSGFLVSIENVVRFDAGDGEREFPIDRLTELRLANPQSRTAGPRLWLTSGEIRDGVLPPGLRPTEAAASSDAIRAGWFVSRERIPLADLELRTSEPGPGRRWAGPPKAGSAWSSPLNVPDLQLDGPMVAEWRLPPDASAFSTVAVLGGTLDNPIAAPGSWADAVLRVSVSGVDQTIVLADIHLGSDQTRAVIGCEIPGVGQPDRVLIIEVLEGAHGPIQDGVLLHRPFLLGR